MQLRSRKSDSTFFTFTGGRFRNNFKAACECVGIQSMQFTPHCCRHGGVSRDCVFKRRTQSELLKRGRWASVKSLSRYEKSGKSQQSITNANPMAKAYALPSMQNLQEVFDGRGKAIKPPFTNVVQFQYGKMGSHCSNIASSHKLRCTKV